VTCGCWGAELAKGFVHYVGEEVAAVAATDPLIAEAALDLIEVEYEVLPSVTSLRRALQADAPQLHEWATGNVALADCTNPDKLQLWTPTQGAPMYQMALAKPHHFIAALLSRVAGKPVKIKATGDEEFIMYRGSGETRYRFRTGVTRDGRLKALEADVTFDAGAHAEWAMILWLPAPYLNWL